MKARCGAWSRGVHALGIYAFIALFEVWGLFLLSLVVEKKLRDRDYAPEWR